MTIDRIGPYILHEKLGEGAMGLVYAGTNVISGESVAVKLLKGHQAEDRGARRRLLAEGRKAALLDDSPQIVRILEVGIDSDRPYVVMERVHGVGLVEFVARMSDASREIWTRSLVLQLAGGVASAHAAELVHRDLKPENILVTDEGVLKILDFGVAKDLRVVTSETLDRPAGTPIYMAPELLEVMLGMRPNDRELTTSKSLDVYSVGVITLELLGEARPLMSAPTYFELLERKKSVREYVRLALSGAPQLHGWKKWLRSSLSAKRNQRPRDGGELAASILSSELAPAGPSTLERPPMGRQVLVVDSATEPQVDQSQGRRRVHGGQHAGSAHCADAAGRRAGAVEE